MPVDPLHDWEIGVGKNVDAHTIRIFHAIGGGAVNLFDTRYVHKPPTRIRQVICYMQVPPSSYLRSRYHPKVWRQCFRHEETRRSRL